MNDTQPAYMVLTWGCQMNEDDSRQMANLLEQMGYRQVFDESDADVILLNTCSVRAKPEQKVRSKLGELRLIKLEKKNLIIGVCGCMAQREGEALQKRMPYIDMVIGTASIPELPMLIEQVKQGRRRLRALDLPEKGSNGASHTHRIIESVGLKTFVPVMYGCNNFCAYCVVPYARGPERSRLPEEILAEVTDLASKGCKEVTLVGQNVNSYGKTLKTADCGLQTAGTDFSGLLELLNGVPGLERIRFMTSHPKDLNDRLIEAMAGLPKVCEHLHLPIQSGDDDVLRRMGRGYTVEHYRALTDKLRDRIPGISLTTDILVGFPGETEEQFENTLKTIEAVRFDAAYTFAYNARPGTAAAKMEDQLDGPTKIRRLREVISSQEKINLEKNQADIGREFEVLVDGQNEKDSSKMIGYTRTSKIITFPGESELAGRIVTVRAKTAHPCGFTGEMVTKGNQEGRKGKAF